MKNKTININQFVADYLTTAAWVTCESGENTDFTKEAKESAKQECLKFIGAVIWEFGKDKANELLTVAGNDLGYLAPYCFFLNRNGHGTGFWDRENEFGENEANLLSEISKAFGESNCYHIRGNKSKLTFE